MSPQDFNFKICFGKTKSVNYKKALVLAKSFNGFKEGEPNILTVSRDEMVRNYKEISQLAGYVQRWADTRFLLNENEPISPREFYKTFSALNCHTKRQKAVIQEIHCWINKDMPGWGCMFLSAVSRHFIGGLRLPSERMYWFELGHFIEDNTWRIDKKEIARLLERQCKLEHLALCPIFDFKKVLKAINELPDEIEASDENWGAIFSGDPEAAKEPIKIWPRVTYEL